MSLDPTTWPAAEVDDYLRRGGSERTLTAASGTGDTAMVVGSTGPFAQLAGRKALEAGGSAVDAVIVTSLTQIALAAGSYVSYAGVFSMLHFSATDSTVDSLSGGFATFADETDPASIPRQPERSGRTALVPGFMAGVEAAHRRFGKLPWASLFEPARYIAEHGFPMGKVREAQFAMRKDVLARTPEIFHTEGRLPSNDDTFRQPALAATLSAVAENGADWMYRGPWAQEFVDAVVREGGRARLEDLAAYEPLWAEPLCTNVFGHEVYSLGAPDRGGVMLLESLNLAEEAAVGDPVTDPESLYWLIQISRQTTRGGADPDREVSREHARETWRRMREAGHCVGPAAIDPGSHSDFVLAVDTSGNVATACHSINTSLWGTTGIFVGGISIPDAASFQQPALAALPPGGHLPFPGNPAIALRDGRPVLASSSIGAGLNVSTLQCMHAVLGLGLSVGTAAARPLFHGPDYLAGDSISGPVQDRLNGPKVGSRWTNAVNRARAAGGPVDQVWNAVMAELPQVVDDAFDPDVLAKAQSMGMELDARPIQDSSIPRGYWGGIALADTSPRLMGARTPFSAGEVEAC
jgi:gamma-glutamyltranspeptidase/glutathione hydrolase